MTQDFNVFVPFNSSKYPDIVKGIHIVNKDGTKGIMETPSGHDTFFKDPTSGLLTKEWYIEGIASTIDVDRDTERMSEQSIKKMEIEILRNPVNIFGNHEHNWENTLGVIKEGKVTDGGRKFWIRAALDDPGSNPKVVQLINKMKRGIGLGFSIGGKVLKTKNENKDGTLVKIIDDIELLEVSVVGIPANPYCHASLSEQIAKSMKTKAPVQPEEDRDIEVGDRIDKCPSCYSKDIENKHCKICGYEIGG